jgi:hypothetical protein
MAKQEDYQTFTQNKEISSHCRGPSFGEVRIETVQASENFGAADGPYLRDPLQSLVFNKVHYQRQINRLISNNRILTREPEVIRPLSKLYQGRHFKSIGHPEQPRIIPKRTPSGGGRPMSASFLS